MREDDNENERRMRLSHHKNEMNNEHDRREQWTIDWNQPKNYAQQQGRVSCAIHSFIYSAGCWSARKNTYRRFASIES